MAPLSPIRDCGCIARGQWVDVRVCCPYLTSRGHVGRLPAGNVSVVARNLAEFLSRPNVARGISHGQQVEHLGEPIRHLNEYLD